MEIHGIAETTGEDIAEKVVKLGSKRSSTCIFLPPISTFVTKPDLVTAAAPNLLLFGLNHIRRKLSCTKLGNI